MANKMPQDGPKTLARACLSCRARKTRCDTKAPACTACVTQGKECVYRQETPRRRPTIARIQELQRQLSACNAFIAKLKTVNSSEKESLLNSASIREGHVQLPETYQDGETRPPASQPSSSQGAESQVVGSSGPQTGRRPSSLGDLDDSSEEDYDIAPFLSVDEAGKPSSFGPSSALHYHPQDEGTSGQSAASLARDNIRNFLIAQAALQRQSERQLASLPDIHGVPTELALHLLDLHWSRQHHTLLLTYRPAIMRDLMRNGPQSSRFLLYAISASSSKFSSRTEVRDDPSDPATAGRRFYKRCDELLAEDSLLIYPKIPTVIGLVLLGSSYNARGEVSKGWLYTGYALRMIYDLGLHLDPKETTDSTEQVEIRRRVFWGAFVADKLQALYLGRPAAINLRDSHVSRDFMDTLEEEELYRPYADAKCPNAQGISSLTAAPIFSVSTFQKLCLLSKIMTKIINIFYVPGATHRNAQASLQLVDNTLHAWRENLPTNLDFKPGLVQSSTSAYPPPNLMNVHALYHSLIILLHRPFISDGHLRSTATPAHSWGRCTLAARNITSIALAWQTAHGLRNGPYLLSYSIYVACTIHVRNSAAEATSGRNREHAHLLAASLSCLEQLCSANPGVSKPMRIIQRLMEAKKIELHPEPPIDHRYSPSSFDFDTIYSMFPNRNPTSSGIQYSGDVVFEPDLPDDPLFGLMDESMMSFTTQPDFFLNGTATY